MNPPPEHLLGNRRADEAELTGTKQPVEPLGAQTSAEASDSLVGPAPDEHRARDAGRLRLVHADRPERIHRRERADVTEHEVDLGTLLHDAHP